jgi:aspartate/methionine/tyrosine aminotransferase
VDELYDVLVNKYDTAFVPGRFFESPQHLRIGLCAEPAAFAGGVERLGRALDQLSS